MIKKISKNKSRQKRHLRIRNRISGTKAIPRLNVYRSNRHIYAELIDDSEGRTIVSACSKNIIGEVESTSSKEAAEKVGELVAKRALEAGYEQAVFDRGGYIYHGRVQALADGARQAGLRFERKPKEE